MEALDVAEINNKAYFLDVSTPSCHASQCHCASIHHCCRGCEKAHPVLQSPPVGSLGQNIRLFTSKVQCVPTLDNQQNTISALPNGAMSSLASWHWVHSTMGICSRTFSYFSPKPCFRLVSPISLNFFQPDWWHF